MTPQNQDPMNDRQRRVRRVAGLAVGGALVASAAVALPALASNRVESAEGAGTTTSTVVTTVPVTTPAAPAGPTLEEQVTARFAAMTPEELAAFSLFTATDEQKEAFTKFVTPPPPPPPVVVKPAAPKAAAKASTGGGTPGNGFLACVRNRESRGNYSAYNPSGASGAYQMMPQTAANTARHAGRGDLANKPVSQWSPADQDAMANHLYQWQGSGPWGGSC